MEVSIRTNLNAIQAINSRIDRIEVVNNPVDTVNRGNQIIADNESQSI